ncbi:hypothetical protein ACQUKI_16155 [Ralstonia pseudosolanacearum]
MSDAPFDGRRLRALTVVDNDIRESLAIEVGQSLKGEDVVGVLDAVVAQRDTPQTMKVDNSCQANKNASTDDPTTPEILYFRAVLIPMQGHAAISPATLFHSRPSCGPHALHAGR